MARVVSQAFGQAQEWELLEQEQGQEWWALELGLSVLELEQLEEQTVSVAIPVVFLAAEAVETTVVAVGFLVLEVEVQRMEEHPCEEYDEEHQT